MDSFQNLLNEILYIDLNNEVEIISRRIRELLSKVLKRRGLIIGLSGGIDSSVTLALAVRAVGSRKVKALLMPERHSADETLPLSSMVADRFGVEKIHEDISDTLDAVGFYRRYEAAVQHILPDYGDGWKSKMVISNVIEKKGFNIFYLVARDPNGLTVKKRLPLKTYLEILAATNFKQRIRKMLEYYHADRNNYAVVGTPNRLEYDQGFFVKLGDGAADVKPIAHLYKSQVYKIADYLGVPEAIINRPPSTDTYSLSQGQDEFYFALPYDRMDYCLYAKNNGIPSESVAKTIGMTEDEVQRVYDDIDAKRATTRYLHLPPLLIKDVPEIG